MVWRPRERLSRTAHLGNHMAEQPPLPKTEHGFCAPFPIDSVPWREHQEGERFGLR